MALRDLIEEMVGLQHATADEAKAAQADPSRRSTLIELRRRFSRHVVIISEAIDQDHQLADDAQLASEFRKRFSDMRAKIAIHQAKWPAVMLDNVDSTFDKSADEVTRSNHAFAEWALNVLRK